MGNIYLQVRSAHSRVFGHRFRSCKLAIAGIIFVAVSYTSVWFGKPDATRVTRDGPRQLFLYSPTGGLGNAIFGLLSVAKLANVLEADLAIDWHSSTNIAFPLAYNELYEAGTMSSNPEVHFPLRCNSSCALDMTHNTPKSCWIAFSCGSIIELRKIFEQCACIHIKSNQYYSALFTRFNSEYTEMTIARNFLQPSTRLKKRTQNVFQRWKKELGVTKVLGVHIRAAFISSEVRNGSFVPQKDIFATYFLPCVLNVSNIYESERLGVFIAADTEEVRKDASQLLAEYHPRIVQLPSPLQNYPNDLMLGPRRSSEDAWGAATELELLRGSDSLIVRKAKTFDSTYSAAAILLSKHCKASQCFAVHASQCTRLYGQEILGAIKRMKPATCSESSQSSDEPCRLNPKEVT